jgi:hypothetical protein
MSRKGEGLPLVVDSGFLGGAVFGSERVRGLTCSLLRTGA